MPHNITIRQFKQSERFPQFPNAFDVALSVDSAFADVTVFQSSQTGQLEPLGRNWMQPGPLHKRLSTLPPSAQFELRRQIMSAIRALKR